MPPLPPSARPLQRYVTPPRDRQRPTPPPMGGIGSDAEEVLTQPISAGSILEVLGSEKQVRRGGAGTVFGYTQLAVASLEGPAAVTVSSPWSSTPTPGSGRHGLHRPPRSRADRLLLRPRVTLQPSRCGQDWAVRRVLASLRTRTHSAAPHGPGSMACHRCSATLIAWLVVEVWAALSVR
jgi:hypothetical protein